MYRYNENDKTIVRERAAQFRGQTQRFLAGELTEDEFKPLRLQNGLYIQRQAPMLRVAIPYGLLSSTQLRALAAIARTYDKGYGHFTTRQNIQFNWPALERVPDILDDLAAVEMHAIQTSGNCIRNITTDAFAGIAPDEIVDPRPWCEILRQWSTFHPEFAFLPRKFKIAVSGATIDRAAVRMHDIGIELYRELNAGEVMARFYVGGGMGRTPIVAPVIAQAVRWPDLLTFCEAILRVYNLHGRRDNIYKARIKILVKALGAEEFARQVQEEFAHLKYGPGMLTRAEVERVSAHFADPQYQPLPAHPAALEDNLKHNAVFARWVQRNVRSHKHAGYAAVTLSLKRAGVAPGDATADEMEAAAKLADIYSFGELRVTHEQNLVLSDVARKDLFALWQEAKALGFANPTIGLLTDLIACPGGDFCSLANARSLPIAEAILQRFDDLDYLHDLGDITLNISGCINSCGHHHNGNIGILGVDKDDKEFYQISLGGRYGHRLPLQGGGREGDGVGVARSSAANPSPSPAFPLKGKGQAAASPETQNDTRVGRIIGPSFAAHQVVGVIERMLAVYVRERSEGEAFVECVDRLGIEPFKRAAYQNLEDAEQTENSYA